MKTLLEQLRPEVVQALEENREQYDLSITDLYDELDTKYLYSELSIGTMRDITVFANIDYFKWDSTDWRYGTKLFKD